jgi:hypothetical protein
MQCMKSALRGHRTLEFDHWTTLNIGRTLLKEDRLARRAGTFDHVCPQSCRRSRLLPSVYYHAIINSQTSLLLETRRDTYRDYMTPLISGRYMASPTCCIHYLNLRLEGETFEVRQLVSMFSTEFEFSNIECSMWNTHNMSGLSRPNSSHICAPCLSRCCP